MKEVKAAGSIVPIIHYTTKDHYNNYQGYQFHQKQKVRFQWVTVMSNICLSRKKAKPPANCRFADRMTIIAGKNKPAHLSQITNNPCYLKRMPLISIYPKKANRSSVSSC